MRDSAEPHPTASAWASGLNAEQLRAVRHGMRSEGGSGESGRSGALVVLAGPGTGKTRVITHRIARMIHADGAAPESIVALTFTVKAAEEMRERLASLVGAATAERVNAHTFHGFGRALLKRFGDVLGVRPRWQLIDSAQRKRVLAGVIIDQNLFPHAAATGRVAEAPTVERFISACRNRAVFPEDCLRYAARWLESSARNERGLDSNQLAADRFRASVFHDRARAYDAFERACRERQWLTFDDLLTLPIRLLREHRHAAAICRDDYRHVVVDEFQDVNAAQIELLRLLAPAAGAEGASGACDLCVVGDDDQAIYAFRGATERAFEHVARFWPGFSQVELTQNYRSTRGVLGVANALIARAESRFAPQKRIEACGERADRPGGIEGVILEEDGHCAEVVGAMLRADRAANPGRAWKSYAVIARANSDLEKIGGELELDGVPVRYVRSLDLGEDEVIKDLHAWIELLVDPRARWSVQRVLGRPPLEVPPMQVGAWVLEHRAEMAAGRDRAKEGGEVTRREEEPFVAWLARRPAAEAGAPPGLRRFLELHGELAAMMLREPAHTVVLRIIEIVGLAEAGLPEPGSESDRERARRIAALVAFLRFSRSRIDRLEQPGGLAEFWSYFQDLDESDRRSLCGDEQERIEEMPEVAGADDDAVTIMTAHKSKGLEFDVVFLPRCRPGGFPDRKRADEEAMLPEEMLAEWQRGGSDAAARAEEERRLFYVACTRARERLVLFAKKKKGRGTTVDFFNELTVDVAGLVTVRLAEEVLSACGAASAGGGGGFDPAAAGVERTADPGRRLGMRLRREARGRLGTLSLRAELDGLSDDELRTICGEMGETAARLALAAHVERYGTVPAWATADGSPIADAARLVAERLAGGESPRTVPLLRPMQAPLKLSYSAISAYERCPRCFYLAEVLGLGEDVGPAMLVGQAAHAALDRFYRAFRSADTGEESAAAMPTREDLVRFGLSELDAVWPRSRPMDAAARDRLAGQLGLFHDSLHDPAIHVLEIEAWSGVAYAHAGVEHRLSARIDRIDQLPDGGIRIVDYKTGHATKRLLTPEPDDLQLGVYALAARSLLGNGSAAADAPATLRGRAEYWLLSTGTRGVIDLAEIDEAAVRTRIDAAIVGMLAGRFPRGEECEGGACGIFGLDD